MKGPKLPEIKPHPGYALGILQTSVARLEDIKADRPDDFDAVDSVMLALKLAVDHWIHLRGVEPFEPEES